MTGVCLSVQKHGLKVYMRDPYSFTPMLEEGVGGRPPRSLLLGADMAMTQKEIGKFSEKDAKVLCQCQEDLDFSKSTFMNLHVTVKSKTQYEFYMFFLSLPYH